MNEILGTQDLEGLHYLIVFADIFIICSENNDMNTDIDWKDVIKKEARGLNDADFGEVQEVSNGVILTQRGIINKEIFSIPQNVVESYDGKVLRLSISEDVATSKFKKHFEKDPSQVSINGDESIHGSIETTSRDSKVVETIHNAIDDTVKEALTSPTAEELGLEKKVERELSALEDERNNTTSVTDVDQPVNHTNSTNQNQPVSNKDKQTNESVNEQVDETSPLKKKEAGIA